MKTYQKVLLSVGGFVSLVGIVLIPSTILIVKRNKENDKGNAPSADVILKKLETYAKSLDPKVKPEKINEKSKTLAASINSEIKLKTWFNGLPISHGDINVKFVSSIAPSIDPSVLEVKYVFQSGGQSYNYQFVEPGFYNESQNGPEAIIAELEAFRDKLRPTIKSEKKDEVANTYTQMITYYNDVKEWFNGLPLSDRAKGIKVEFVSASPSLWDPSTVEVKYKISKGDQSISYSFSQSGFKVSKPEFKIYQSESGIKFSNEGEVLGLSGATTQSLVISSRLKDKDSQVEVPIKTIAQKAFKSKWIKSLTIGSSITKINDSAFDNSRIKELTFESGSQLKHIGNNAFAEHQIENISIPQDVEFIDVGAFQTLQHIANRPLQTINFNGNDKLTKINRSTFYGNLFREIDLPINLETIGYGAFDNRNTLKEYNLTVYYHKKEFKNENSIFRGYTNVTFIKK